MKSRCYPFGSYADLFYLFSVWGDSGERLVECDLMGLS